MDLLNEAYAYIIANSEIFIVGIKEHLALSATAILIGILVCVPLGGLVAKSKTISAIILNIVSFGRIIPSLAVLAIMMPYVGVGFTPSLIALTLLACPPILINTATAFKELDKHIIEAAYGMGMEKCRVLRKITIPLALPVIIAGIRTASVEVVASATLAAFIGGGGLGEFIVNGIALGKISILLVGAIPIALLSLLVEMMFSRIEKLASPPMA